MCLPRGKAPPRASAVTPAVGTPGCDSPRQRCRLTAAAAAVCSMRRSPGSRCAGRLFARAPRHTASRLTHDGPIGAPQAPAAGC
eukprot:356261-Chlamydomonas_euryale.AAC.5